MSADLIHQGHLNIISEDQLPKLVDESFTKGRMDNNIVDLDESMIMSILKENLR